MHVNNLDIFDEVNHPFDTNLIIARSLVTVILFLPFFRINYRFLARLISFLAFAIAFISALFLLSSCRERYNSKRS